MPEPNRPPLRFVVAPSVQWFVGWCQQDCEPPENPRAADFVLFTGAMSQYRVQGYRWVEGDLVYILGDPTWSGVEEAVRALIGQGHSQYLNDDGMPLALRDRLESILVSQELGFIPGPRREDVRREH